MYFGPPFYDYDLNGQCVYLTIPGKRSLSMMKQNLLVLFICNHKKGKFTYHYIHRPETNT